MNPIIIFYDKFLPFFLFAKRFLKKEKKGMEKRSTFFDSISRKRTRRFENEFELGNDRRRGDWPAVHPVRLYSCKLRIRAESARPTLETRRGQKLVRLGWRRTSEAMKRSCYHLVTSVGPSHRKERGGSMCMCVCVCARDAFKRHRGVGWSRLGPRA